MAHDNGAVASRGYTSFIRCYTMTDEYILRGTEGEGGGGGGAGKP